MRPHILLTKLVLLSWLAIPAAWACDPDQQLIFSCAAHDAQVEVCQSDLALHMTLTTQASPQELRVPLSDLRWELDAGSGMQMNRLTWLALPFAYRLTVDETIEREYGEGEFVQGQKAAWVEVLLLHGGAAETGRYTCEGPIEFYNDRIRAKPRQWWDDPEYLNAGRSTP